MDRASAAAVGLGSATLALAVAGLALGGGTLGGASGAERSISAGDVFLLLSLLATTVVGLIIAVRRPGNPIGWIFSWYALITAVYLAAGGYAVHDAVAPGTLPGGEWAAWFRNWADRCVASLVLLAFLLFPTGRVASQRWRPALALPLLMALGMAARAFVPGPMDFLGRPNPLGVAWMPQSVNNGFAGGVPAMGGAVVAYMQLSRRYRAAGRAERQQIKWLAIPVVALAIALLATVIDLALGGSGGGAGISALYAVVELLLPICMGIAVLRYRLYEIDVLINRALVYGATTGAIAIAFFAGIVVLQAALRPLTSGSEFAVAASTLVSFALFQPIRRRIQDVVDRRFFRTRYDAARTLDAFSVHLRDEVALDAVRADLLAAVRDTVQPAHASVWLR
jgi:hypothetical protein